MLSSMSEICVPSWYNSISTCLEGREIKEEEVVGEGRKRRWLGVGLELRRCVDSMCNSVDQVC